MKKLTKLPTTNLRPTYCERISETEVIHYTLPFQFIILSFKKNNKEILENYFKEEVEITDSEDVRPEVCRAKMVQIPESGCKTKTDRMFSNYFNIMEPTFIQKIKLFANKYLKCRFSVKTLAKAYAVAVKYYEGQEKLAVDQFKASLELNPVDGWLLKPSIMPLADTILGTRNTYVLVAFPVRLLDSELHSYEKLRMDRYVSNVDCYELFPIEEPITVKEVIDIIVPDNETEQL